MENKSLDIDESKNTPYLLYKSGTIYAETLSGRRILLDDVEFSIEKGKSYALIGETGSGKTMIAMSIMGLLPKNVKGENLFCSLDSVDISSPVVASSLLGREIAYIPQNGMEFLNPSRTIYAHLIDSLLRSGTPKKEVKEKAKEILSLVGFHDIDQILKSYPFQLSGGMAQRVTVALALSSNAKLIIADEPTNGLDLESSNKMLEHLFSLFSDAAKIIITHDISVASRCENMLVLCGGKTMEKGPSSFLSSPCNPYAKSLVAALVKNGMKSSPYLRNMGNCPFSERCPEYSDICEESLSHYTDGEHEWWCKR